MLFEELSSFLVYVLAAFNTVRQEGDVLRLMREHKLNSDLIAFFNAFFRMRK